jgi:hypothetical protein
MSGRAIAICVFIAPSVPFFIWMVARIIRDRRQANGAKP